MEHKPMLIEREYTGTVYETLNHRKFLNRDEALLYAEYVHQTIKPLTLFTFNVIPTAMMPLDRKSQYKNHDVLKMRFASSDEFKNNRQDKENALYETYSILAESKGEALMYFYKRFVSKPILQVDAFIENNIRPEKPHTHYLETIVEAEQSRDLSVGQNINELEVIIRHGIIKPESKMIVGKNTSNKEVKLVLASSLMQDNKEIESLIQLYTILK